MCYRLRHRRFSFSFSQDRKITKMSQAYAQSRQVTCHRSNLQAIEETILEQRVVHIEAVPVGVARGVLAIILKRTSTSGASDIRHQALPTTVHDWKYASSCGFGISQPSIKEFPVSEPTYQKNPTSFQVCSPKIFSPSQDIALYWLLPTMVSAFNIPIDQGSINQPYLPSLTNITGTNVLLNDSSTLNGRIVACKAPPT